MLQKEQKYVEKCSKRNKSEMKMLRGGAKTSECGVKIFRAIFWNSSKVLFLFGKIFVPKSEKSFAPKNLAPLMNKSCDRAW